MNNIFLGYPPENIRQWIKSHSGPDLSIPLCFEAVDAGATIALKCNGTSLKTAAFQTSTDGNTWSDYTYATNVTLANAGDKVYFKAKEDNTSIARTSSNYLQFTTTQAAKKVNVSGNVMSLLAPDFKGLINLNTIRSGNAGTYQFYKTFYSCKNIKDCSNLNLPATTLADYCYSQMFYGCTSLTEAPVLPVTTLADKCYYGMFQSCTSLTEAPVLPATTLASSCYSGMFQDCTSLTEAPVLPATTLANNCYSQMFQDCTSLTEAPVLPATTLADSCYYSMFQRCTSLTEAPVLPATTLANNCYYSMFYGCTSLTEAPVLPATTLASSCYGYMFQSCTSLTEAPVIKTYTPDLYAFNGMLDMVDWYTVKWGQLTACNWPDLTLDEAEAMVLNESIFGYGDSGIYARISITCKDGNATAYYDPGNQSWVFEY